MPDRRESALVVLMGGRVAAVVAQRAGRLELTYDDVWREHGEATPLSLALPLAARVHSDASVRPFLWGLLPDSDQVLDRWARAYQVSPQNPFALLRHVGEDCAGAAQFVVPERVDALAAGDGGIGWLDDVARLWPPATSSGHALQHPRDGADRPTARRGRGAGTG